MYRKVITITQDDRFLSLLNVLYRWVFTQQPELYTGYISIKVWFIIQSGYMFISDESLTKDYRKDVQFIKLKIH